MAVLRILTAAGMVAASLVLGGPANADPPPPGCERVPIFGLNPQVREICDTPIQPDGAWTRFRSFRYPATRQLTCRPFNDDCPQWAQRWVDVPAIESPVDTYIVTADTIPPGEPGHLG